MALFIPETTPVGGASQHNGFFQNETAQVGSESTRARKFILKGLLGIFVEWDTELNKAYLYRLAVCTMLDCNRDPAPVFIVRIQTSEIMPMTIIKTFTRFRASAVCVMCLLRNKIIDNE